MTKQERAEKKRAKRAEKETEKSREIVKLDDFTRNKTAIDNEIINSKNNLTATEMKIFLQCSTLIDSVADKYLKEYEMPMKQFCYALNIENNNRYALITTLQKLLKQVFEINNEVTGDYVGYPIFSKLEYRHKAQKIVIAFNDYLERFLLEFRKGFTNIDNRQTQKLESKYAVRFYLYLKQFRLMTYRDFEISQLKTELKLPNSYNYTRFYQRVITPALLEINTKTDLEMSEPEIIEKVGNKITKIRIYFNHKSSEIATQFCKDLLEKWRKTQSKQVFLGCYCYEQRYKIADIEFSRDYCRAVTENNETILGYPTKGDFIQMLVLAIYEAVLYTYETEKKPFIPKEMWQDKQDRLKHLKEIFNQWNSGRAERFEKNYTAKEPNEKKPKSQESQELKTAKNSESKREGKGFEKILNLKNDIEAKRAERENEQEPKEQKNQEPREKRLERKRLQNLRDFYTDEKGQKPTKKPLRVSGAEYFYNKDN